MQTEGRQWAPLGVQMAIRKHLSMCAMSQILKSSTLVVDYQGHFPLGKNRYKHLESSKQQLCKVNKKLITCTLLLFSGFCGVYFKSEYLWWNSLH